MKEQRTAANVLQREVAVTVREHAGVPAQRVYDVLADLPGHPGWGGAEASTLLSMDAPPGPARAGTEFTSTAEDAICRMRDSSVVTEAVRPVRASALPGVLAIYGIPVLRSLASLEWARASRAGLRRLIAAAETIARA
jgi:hypothetical protein